MRPHNSQPRLTHPVSGNIPIQAAKEKKPFRYPGICRDLPADYVPPAGTGEPTIRLKVCVRGGGERRFISLCVPLFTISPRSNARTL